MTRVQRISWALLLAASACGDDVSGVDEGSSSDGSSTTGDVIPMNPTTGVTMTTMSSSGDTTGDDTEGTTGSAETDGGDTEGTSGESGDDTTGDDTTGDDTSTGQDTDETTGSMSMCGDGTVDGDEQCDGADLGDATCASEGFVGGALGCADDCTFDTSACETCGNATIDDGEDCDGDALGDATCASIGMGFTGGALACDAMCGFDTSGCTSLAQPAAGEVIISEIMPNPSVVPDADGEWFELHNPSDSVSYQLGGCEITGNVGEEVIAIDELVIEPGAYLTFAPSSDADIGFTPDVEWEENYAINNSGEPIGLSCAGASVDVVDYSGFPIAATTSLNLDPDFFDATANDMAANWCAGTTAYNVAGDVTDFGTPGAANIECAEPQTYSIDFCRLQFPTTIDEDAGAMVDVFGRLYIEGLTDMSTGNDVADEVSGQIGYGPDGTDPAVDDTWTWIDAAPNVGWDGAAAGEADNDEYQASLTVPSPGDYDFAVRFSGDSGASYTYCDGMAAGSSDGYQVANAGAMTSTASGVEFDLIFSEYIEGSGNNKALEIYNGSLDALDLSACQVENYANGSLTPSSTFALSGTLEAGDAIVACRSSADTELLDVCDLPTGSNAVNFNGDDAVVLACEGEQIDIIGRIGEDPGSFWPTSDVNPDPSADTQNETLRRNCDADADADGSDDFDPSTDWTSFAQDSFDDLGQYICE